MPSGFSMGNYELAKLWREKKLAEQAQRDELRKAAEAPGRAEQIEKRIEAAVNASPDKIVLIVGKDHLDNNPGSMHASSLPSFISSKTWDHAAIAYRDKESGKIVFMEKTPSRDGIGPFGSTNHSGTIKDLAKYPSLDVVALNLSRDYGKGAGDRFIKGATAAVNAQYSFFSFNGDTCSSAFLAGMREARSQSVGGVMENMWSYASKSFWWAAALFNTFTPTDAYALAKDHSVNAAPDFRAAFEMYAANDDDQEASSEHSVLASDPEHARPDDAAQQPKTDDDQDASQEQVALASDAEEARPDDAAQQLETDDDEASSQEQVALASDAENARPDDAAQQPKTDDDEDAPQEELVDASDAEDAAADDAAAVMASAKMEAEADPTADDDQAEPPLAAASPVTADDGFSFSMFPKPGAPTEVVKEALPGEQASPVEAISGSGMAGSESALPDEGSMDVGNAAPSKEHVVHHGDLAP